MALPKLLTISGSLRKGSFNRMLLTEATAAFGEADVTQADINLPLYDGDLEDAEGVPAAAKTLAEQITAADAVLIASPEYNKGISGALKNAIDWLSRLEGNVWDTKPVVVMAAAAGRGGGETGMFMTMHCLLQMKARLIQGAPIMVAAAYEAFDDDGHLKADGYRDAVSARMAQLRAEIA